MEDIENVTSLIILIKRSTSILIKAGVGINERQFNLGRDWQVYLLSTK